MTSSEGIVVLQAPPLPYYLGAGRSDYRAGEGHPSRRNLGLYDLLIVVNGELHMGENGQEWVLTEGETLLLLPDGEHYPTQACDRETSFYWVHFEHAQTAAAHSLRPDHRPFHNPYSVRIPKHARLSDPRAAADIMKALLSPQAEGLFWEEQRLFAELLALLGDRRGDDRDSPAYALAERAAAYIQRNFSTELTNETLAQALHFHPNYVVRCMKMRYGRTPMDHLHQYRIERAKRLLITTGWSIARIAEETGFRYAPYFSACFKRSVGLSPLRYRKQYLT